MRHGRFSTDERAAIVNAADCIHETKELRDAIAAFRRARPNDPAIFVTAGKVSNRAQRARSEFGAEVIESGNTTLVERVSRQPIRR